MRKIVVTGANGQLGRELQALAASQEDEFLFTDRATLDLGSTRSIESFFEANACDAIVNCGAYTAVDRAQSEPEAAEAANHHGVSALARIAKAEGLTLVHLSTDYVFDGTAHLPYVETDATNPQGIYGATKLAGENALRQIAPANALILRTSWVYSRFGHNFVKTMLRLGRERDELGVVFDQVGTPTHAADLAQAICQLLPQIECDRPEIYHYSNEGVCSWYDFAKAVFELSGVECSVAPIETRAYPTPARRPHYSLLNKAKIKARFGLEIPHWRESLARCVAALEKERA